MQTRWITAVIAALVLAGAGAAAAQNGYNLTFEEALDLARRRAPVLVAARAASEVARGRRGGIYRWTRGNPEVSFDAGPRFVEGGSDRVDVDVGVEQRFELGGRGSARIAIADADVERADAAAENAMRRLLGEVASSFIAVLHRDERLAIAREEERLSAERLHVVERREASGDVGALDANIARVALARARARALASDATRMTALGELRVLLDLDPSVPLTLRGDLRQRTSPTLDELLARASERPDLKALAAEVERADAELDLGRGSAWPELGLRAGYEREEDADIALAGFTLTLPTFDRGQALRAAATARRGAASARLEAARRAVVDEVRTSFAAHDALVHAAGGLESDALPLLAENERLARRSYELGRIGLGELLVAGREMLAARRAHVDLLRDAALAGVDLQVRSGDLP